MRSRQSIVGVEPVRQQDQVAHTRIIGKDWVERHGSAAGTAALVENVSHGLSRKGAAGVRFLDRAFDGGSPVLVEQTQQACSGATEVASVQRDGLEKGGGAGTTRTEPIATALGTGLAFFIGEASEVVLALDLLVLVPTAGMSGHLHFAIEQPHVGVRGDEGQWLSHQGMRNRVVVSVEAHVRSLSRANRLDQITRERMLGLRHRWRDELAGGDRAQQPRSPGAHGSHEAHPRGFSRSAADPKRGRMKRCAPSRDEAVRAIATRVQDRPLRHRHW
jgi:hypothetical protein